MTNQKLEKQSMKSGTGRWTRRHGPQLDGREVRGRLYRQKVIQRSSRPRGLNRAGQPRNTLPGRARHRRNDHHHKEAPGKRLQLQHALADTGGLSEHIGETSRRHGSKSLGKCPRPRAAQELCDLLDQHSSPGASRQCRRGSRTCRCRRRPSR